ncbi:MULTISPECIES: hypothetical protein [Rodentibacter]|nr:hypothetical protein [Rodentibacter sp. JRC1]GJI54991.1 hypothetical protein HEMROJRC1_01030 [Rodentibacter sp. JRC1]
MKKILFVFAISALLGACSVSGGIGAGGGSNGVGVGLGIGTGFGF